jgi:hypothetical protein
MEFTAVYDVDISLLRRPDDTVEIRTALRLHPRESDRLGIRLIARLVGPVRGWQITPVFLTNFGTYEHAEVECVLPRSRWSFHDIKHFEQAWLAEQLQRASESEAKEASIELMQIEASLEKAEEDVAKWSEEGRTERPPRQPRWPGAPY